MATWRYKIVEVNEFCVDLDTEDEDKACEIIRDMLNSGEIRIDRPDYFDQTESVELA